MGVFGSLFYQRPSVGIQLEQAKEGDNKCRKATRMLGHGAISGRCSEKELTGHLRCTQPKPMPSMPVAASLRASVASFSSIARTVKFGTGIATAMTRIRHGTRNTDGDRIARVGEQTAGVRKCTVHRLNLYRRGSAHDPRWVSVLDAAYFQWAGGARKHRSN